MNLILLILLSFSAHSNSFYSGAQSLGFAGSGRAGLESAEAVFLNPSLLGFNRSEFLVNYADGSLEESAHSTNMGFTVVDSDPTNVSPGSFSYRRLRRFGGDRPVPVEGDLWHGALGKLITPNLAFGVSLYRLSFKGQGLSIPHQWNGSVGLTYLVGSDLGLAYVLDAPFKGSSRIPEDLEQPTLHNFGLYYKLMENSRLRVDLSKQDLSVGYEIKSSDFFIMRLGHRWEASTEQNRFGAGVGFNGPRLKLDYGFQQNLKDSESMHGVDLRIPF